MSASVSFPAISSESTTWSSSSVKIPQHAIDSLPMPPHGPPPALADRSTWISSLEAWRRFKNREQDEGPESTSDDHTSEADVSVLNDCDYTLSSAFDDERSSSLSTSSSDCEGYYATSSDAAPRSALTRFSLAAAIERRPSTAPHLFFRTMPGGELNNESSPETLAQPIVSTSSPLTDLVHVSVWDADDERGYSPDSDSVTECDMLSILEDASSDEGLDGHWEDIRTIASDTDDLAKPDARSTATFSHQESDGGASPETKLEQIPKSNSTVVETVQESIHEPANVLPASSSPSPTAEFKKLVGPLSNWVADYIWGHCSGGSRAYFTDGEQEMHTSFHPTPSYLADVIQSCLLATLLQPSVVLLGLFYITRLPTSFESLHVLDTPQANFRRVLLGEGLVSRESQERANLELYAPFKLFVNGVLLASKMLDDHTFSNKTWHEVSRIQARDINALELHSLEVLRYDLSFRDGTWTQWLLSLRTYHLSLPRRLDPIGPLKDSPHAIVLRVLDELLAASPPYQPGVLVEPVFLGLHERIKQHGVVTIIEEVSDTDCDPDDDDGSLYQASLLLEQSIFGSPHNRPVPSPADWAPAHDPPLFKRARPQYIAVQPPSPASVPFADARVPFINKGRLSRGGSFAHITAPLQSAFSSDYLWWAQPSSSQVPYHWPFGSVSGYVSPQHAQYVGYEYAGVQQDNSSMASACYLPCASFSGSAAMPCGIAHHQYQGVPRRPLTWVNVVCA